MMRSTIVGLYILLQSLFICAFPATLKLERAFPVDYPMKISTLEHRDSLRHGVRLHKQSSSAPIVNLTLQAAYEYNVSGLYYTRVQLGTPPKEYYLEVDTGNYVSWVGCSPCYDCSESSILKGPLHFYDPSNSSTASILSCSEERCGLYSDSMCTSSVNCQYGIDYSVNGTTEGYFVSDLIHLDTTVGPSTPSNAFAEVVFGCSTSRNGSLAVDGILGLGPDVRSIVSQLTMQRKIPVGFSHCLVGSGRGGGSLVFGHVVEPNMVYTPLDLLEQDKYYVSLQSISVKGRILPINSSIFAPTIVDSGTSLAYLPEEAYHQFVKAISQSVSKSIQPGSIRKDLCYFVNESTLHEFPKASLNFAGGASMMLRPRDYLVPQSPLDDMAGEWCIGFRKAMNKYTIIGDLFLKDKIIAYDAIDGRLGWKDHNCTLPVTVNTSGDISEYVNNRLIAIHVMILIMALVV